MGDWGEGNLKRGGIGERSFFPGASAEERELFVIRTVEERVVSVTVPRRDVSIVAFFYGEYFIV